jgi:hypothetical protein
LYVTLIGFILKNLWQVASGKWPVAMPQATSYQLPAFLMFLGISIAALFLHAWEDVAVAYTGWVLVAGVMYSKKKT